MNEEHHSLDKRQSQEDHFVYIEPFSWIPFIIGLLLLGALVLASQNHIPDLIHELSLKIQGTLSDWIGQSIYYATLQKLNISDHLMLILRMGALLFLGAMLSKVIVWPINYFASWSCYSFHNGLRKWLERQNEKLRRRKPGDSEKNSRNKKYLDWIDIRTFLEVEHFTSLVSQIGRLGISDSLRIEKFENTFISTRRLGEIRRLLFKIDDAVLLSGARYDEGNRADKVSDDIKELRRTRARFGLTQTAMELIGIIRLLASLTIPVLFAFGIFLFFSSYFPNVFGRYEGGMGQLFLILAGLISVVPVALIAGKIISLCGIFLVLKRSNRQDLLALNILIILVVSFLVFNLFFLTFSYFSYLLQTKASDVVLLSAVFRAANDILLPFNTSSGILNALPPAAIIVARIIGVIGTSVLLYILFRYAADLYESTFYDRSSKGVSIPPEMIRIGGAFLIFLYSTAILYTVFINIKQITSQHAPVAAERTTDSTKPGAQNVIVQVEPQSTPQPDGFNFSGYLPYSVFIALIGGLLALSTRELLENYFHGLSLRVDTPFEEGDRVVFNDSGMTAIDKIGVRAVTVYEISTNSKITIPWKDVTKSLIRNYTRPTLDYRREITVNLPISTQKHETIPDGVLHRAELLLMLTAMFEPGVKRPFVGNIVTQKELVEHLSSIKLFSTNVQNKIIYTDNLDNNELFKIWDKIGFEKLDDRTAFNHIFCSEIPNILQDIENHQPKNIDYKGFQESTAALEQSKEIQSILSIKHRISELILCIYHMDLIAKEAIQTRTEHSQTDDDEISLSQQYDVSDLLRKQAVHLMSDEQLFKCAILATRISAIYADISLLLWSFKTFQERAKSIVTLRKLDSLSVALLTPPRIYSEHKVTEKGDGYWEVHLQITVEMAEQSDEIVQHINLTIEKLWERFIE